MKDIIENDIRNIFGDEIISLYWNSNRHVWALSVLNMLDSIHETKLTLAKNGYYPLYYLYENLYIEFLPTNKTIERIEK